MAAGRAKLRHQETKKRIAIGNGHQIFWSPVFENNPYLLRTPTPDGEWIIDYPGHRPYIWRKLQNVPERRAVLRGQFKWTWNEDHRAEPAELFWTPGEENLRNQIGERKFVVIEPHIKPKAPPAKRWPFAYFQEVVRELYNTIEFIQFDTGQQILAGVTPVRADFRNACAWISKAAAFLGPEGGLHHAAAATGTKGVVIFGAYIKPSITGYPIHTNLYRDDPRALGVRIPNAYAQQAMLSISPREVTDALASLL